MGDGVVGPRGMMTGAGPTVCLLGGPRVLVEGRRPRVPEASLRLLAYVALHDRRLERRQVAGTLWPQGDDLRASGSLRTALWRLRHAGIDVVQADAGAVWLTPGTGVDVHTLWQWAGRVIDGTAPETDLRIMQWDPEAADLLPGWYDDWVISWRERLRQRVLHGLESLSAWLCRLGRHAEAVEAALDAVDLEPLRESAHRALITAHLAEGNVVEARRALQRYTRRLHRELGVAADTDLVGLVCRARTQGS